MSLRRLESEELRDAILFVADRLSLGLKGPSVPVTENSEGKIVIGRRLKRDGIKTGVDSSANAVARRSIYVQVQRKLPLNMLAAFDQPVMNPNCDVRRPSTVATQSLWFLNDSEIVDRSRQLADLLIKNEPQPDDRIQQLFVKLFSQMPSDAELQSCGDFLAEQATHFASPSESDTMTANHQALATLCQTLLASNRFLYVD